MTSCEIDRVLHNLGQKLINKYSNENVYEKIYIGHIKIKSYSILKTG